MRVCQIYCLLYESRKFAIMRKRMLPNLRPVSNERIERRKVPQNCRAYSDRLTLFSGCIAKVLVNGYPASKAW
jgi:hypothetical protein